MTKDKYVKGENASDKGPGGKYPWGGGIMQEAELDAIRDGLAEMQRTRRRLLCDDLEKKCPGNGTCSCKGLNLEKVMSLRKTESRGRAE